MKSFKKIDIYGQPFRFTIFGNKLHKTAMGGLLTIFTTAVMAIVTYFLGQNFYFRKSPVINRDFTQLSEYPHYNINNTNFIFGFRIEDSNGNLFNESRYFSFKVIYNYIDIEYSNNNIYQTRQAFKMDLDFCDVENLKNLNIGSNLDSQRFYCVDFSDNLKYGGFIDSKNFSFFEVQVIQCNLDPERNISTCATTDETLNYLKRNKLYFNMLTLKYSTNFKSLDKPLINHITNNFLMMDINFFKKQYCYFKLGKVLSDIGYVTENIDVKSGFALDYLTYDFIKNSDYSLKLIKINVYFTRNEEKFHRNFIKLQDLMAVLLSVFKLISIFFHLIAYFVNETNIQNKLLEELYDFTFLYKPKVKLENLEKFRKIFSTPNKNINDDLEFRNNKDKNFSIEKIGDEKDDSDNSGKKSLKNEMQKINLKSQSKEIELEMYPNLLNLNEAQIEFLDEKYNENYRFSKYLLLKSIFCSKYFSSRETYLSQVHSCGIKQLIEKTDIVGLFKNIEDINEMKQVLFNKYQAMCFNFIKKPSIDEKILKNNDLFSNIVNNLKQDKNIEKREIVNYFYTKQNNYSEYDTKLFDSLEDNLKIFISIINN